MVLIKINLTGLKGLFHGSAHVQAIMFAHLISLFKN